MVWEGEERRKVEVEWERRYDQMDHRLMSIEDKVGKIYHVLCNEEDPSKSYVVRMDRV